MKLANPVIVNIPSITRNGVKIDFEPLAVETFNPILTDDGRTLAARVPGVPKCFVLLDRKQYLIDGANWSQELAEARLLEVIGPDPKTVFEAAFKRL